MKIVMSRRAGHMQKCWLLTALLIGGCAASGDGAKRPAPAQPAILSARDLAVRPGANFFRYSGGAWYDQAQIPVDQPAIGSMSTIHDDVEMQIRQILEDSGGAPNGAARQAGDLYASWMDTAAIEAKGVGALSSYLARISEVSSTRALIPLFADPAYGSPLSITVFPDPAQPTRYAVVIAQGGLGMPTRDHYLREGEKYELIRTAYRRYVAHMLNLAAVSDAEARADAIVALETELAKAHWDAARSRDIAQANNPMDRAQLQALAPQFDWPTLLDQLGVAKNDPLIVRQTSAITEAGKLIEARPLALWKDYLAYHFIRRHAQFLPKAFDQANFDFFQRTLRDVPRQRDRWKQGVDLTNAYLGDTVGMLYVKRHYAAETRRQVTEMVANIRGAFADRIANLAWMDDATRKEALAKLAALDTQIGHPDRYADYAPLAIRRDDLIGNVIRARRFAWKQDLDRLKSPVSRSQWTSTPQTINARYNILLNQITLPAAVMQPPIFDLGADPAFNYGGIGSLIGHEIGHGFDDQGRRFDASGKLRDWWSPTSAAQFEKRAAALKLQYDGYEALPGLHVNGRLTLGENIGDLGGVEVAYAAYRRYVAAHGEPPVINGMTGDQRFFLGFAQVWRAKTRPGLLRELVLSDPHSPPEFRVNTVRNVDAWYKAFGVEPTDALYLPPERRISIW